MQIEIISNINMDSLKFYLKGFEVKNSCSYGNYLIDLLDVSSKLYSAQTSCIVCFLDVDSLNENLDEVLNALLNIKKSGKIVIINTLSFYPFYLDTFIYETLEKELQYNQKILTFAKENSFLVLDFNTIVKRVGHESIYSDKFWYLGKIKYSAKGFEAIANEIKSLLNANSTSCKKCLALDLDNTLWGGIIGEDEIELSNEGRGAIYQEFQKSIKRLKDFGVILVINSKNNYNDAIKGLEHNSSILKKEDFIIIKANWQNKNENLQEIANELNIGEDSIVFIDDNPVERELVRATTKVNVPEFPEDITDLNTWFKKEVVYNYFFKVKVNEEDKEKQNQYKAKLKRDEASKSMSYEEFLDSLEIQLTFYIDDKTNVQRYAQLTQKTNQFNLTTKRYTQQDIENFIDNEHYRVIAVEYKDKYAREGIIGLCIIDIDEEIVYIDTFLLSCRVLKRGVEVALIKKIMELIPKGKKLVGEYIQTPKNEIVKHMYTTLGFTKIDETKYEKQNL